jgi:hypothetical protein
MKLDLTRETEVQAAVMRVYQAFGCEVRRFNEGRRTRVSVGWPDIFVFNRQKATHWVHEAKVPGGQQSEEQSATQELCEACHLSYVLGGVHEAQQQLQKVGLLTAVPA